MMYDISNIYLTICRLYRLCRFVKQSPSFFPTGWAGDIGDGPTTAYDALPPKPYKADAKK